MAYPMNHRGVRYWDSISYGTDIEQTEPRPKQVSNDAKQQWLNQRFKYRMEGRGHVYDTHVCSNSHFGAVFLRAAARSRRAGEYKASRRSVKFARSVRAQSAYNLIMTNGCNNGI